jgi:glycosyltransferase involved in cell wall biosynthesis
MIRVAHLTSVHPQPDTRIFVKECRTLAAAGYDVTLVAPLDADDRRDGVALRAVPRPGGRRERMTRTVSAVLALARELDADLYHLHDPELLGAGLRLRRLGRRVVYDAHEDLPDDILSKSWIAPPLRRPLSAAARRAEGFAAARLDAVVAASPAIAARFAGAVTVQNYPIASELDGAARPWTEREEAVCYVGALTAIRGTREMVDAAGLAGVDLLLAGTWAEPGDRAAATGRPGWARVDEHGQLERPAVAALMARARAGLLVVHPEPNHLDVHARSNKLFEYMSAGLPVIVSDLPGLRRLVDEHGCGVCVDPRDPQAIAAAMRQLVDDVGEAERMGARGREAVRRLYSWESEGRRLLDLYATLLAR